MQVWVAQNNNEKLFSRKPKIYAEKKLANPLRVIRYLSHLWKEIGDERRYAKKNILQPYLGHHWLVTWKL